MNFKVHHIQISLDIEFFNIIKSYRKSKLSRHIKLNHTNIAFIIAGSNTKILKTYRLLNKMLSLFALPSAYWDLHFLHLPQRQSFFSSWTQYSVNFKRHKWSYVPYIFSFSGLKMAFSKLSLAKNYCLHKQSCLQ